MLGGDVRGRRQQGGGAMRSRRRAAEDRASDRGGSTRRHVLAALGAGGLLALAGPARTRAAGTGDGDEAAGPDFAGAFLKAHASVDIHAHPGRFFLEGLPPDLPAVAALGAPQTMEVIADMATGGGITAAFAMVADLPVLGIREGHIFVSRDFQPGEAWASYRRQRRILEDLVSGSGLRHIDRPHDIRAAHAAGAGGAIFAVEGGDFLEASSERLARVAADGVRIVTLVHYRVNELADNQTSAPVHHGLSAAGRALIPAFERNAVLLDLAHASEDATRQALEIATRPTLLSHSTLRRPGLEHPRLVSAAHARLVAEHGGVIGVVPWGIGQTSLADYVQEILRMIDTVGIDHVAIGTDMDATYKPVMTSYRQWPALVAGLHRAGLSDDELVKVVSGNFLRVWHAVSDSGKAPSHG